MKHLVTALAGVPIFARTSTIDEPAGQHAARIALLRARYARRGYSLAALDDGQFLVSGHGHEHRLRNLRVVEHTIGELECLSCAG